MNSQPLKYLRKNRIRKRGDFLRVYGEGARLQSAHFLLYGLAASDCPRFGMAVSRKAGNAVRRNRVKRLLREFYRLRQRDFTDLELVVVAKKGIGNASLNLGEVDDELLPLSRRLRQVQTVVKK